MKRFDPKNPTSGELLYANFDGGISRMQNKFSKLTAWDSKLKLHWIRYAALPFMAVPTIVKLIDWYAQIRNTTYEQLTEGRIIVPWLVSIFVWLYQNGILGVLVILFTWSFLVTLSKLNKSERNLRMTTSKRNIAGTAFNYAFLFMGVKYLLPSMHAIFYFSLTLLVIGDLFRIPILRRFQQDNGSLDVESFMKKVKRTFRKKEKANRADNRRNKKKHGRP
ncbi:hypothetical protein [Paenibacillus sp. FSL R7-0026]|uniref:hypothetical protein n=1 Tax=Paenibacillus sp. FSL R7-0026 TaxID=2921668 RepID=UPI0030FBA067